MLDLLEIRVYMKKQLYRNRCHIYIQKSEI